MNEIVKNAKQSTGLSDMGGDELDMVKRYDPLFKLGLSRSNVQLSPSGIYFSVSTLTKRVETRLKLIDFLKKHPDISSINVRRPVFVIGFPRTGTTFLHELLGLHPEVRMHYSWEQMEPIPNCDHESLAMRTLDRKKRYNKNKGELAKILMVAGDAIQSIHRIGYDEPEECSTPCGMEVPFNITTIPLLPFVAKEVGDLGAGNAFNLYKKYLQVLAWQDENRQGEFTWMLKCPFHLPYLSELHASFPDATVVWTHRDPVECIASACSLYETIIKMVINSWTIDKHALGKAVMDYTAYSLDKAVASIEKASATMRILHVRYADNIKNPKEICRKVFEKAELPFSTEYDERIDSYLAKNAEQRRKLKEQKIKEESAGLKKKAVLHAYSLQDYGLSEDMVLERFSWYIEKYNLREKK